MSPFVEVLGENPLGILSANSASSQDALNLVKSYIDGLISQEESHGKSKHVLDEIVVEGLDANQVWGQARLVLENVETNLMESIATLKEATSEHAGDKYDSDIEEESSLEAPHTDDDQDLNSSGGESSPAAEDVIDESDLEKDSEDNRDDIDSGDVEDESKESSNNTLLAVEKEVSTVQDKYGLNDQFFNLEKFNQQTIAQERENQEDDDDEIDYFADLPSEEEEQALYYDDFFDQPDSTKNQKESRKSIQHSHSDTEDVEDVYDQAMKSAKMDLFAEDENDLDVSENEKPAENLSSFQLQQAEIQRQIAQLEQEAVAEKKWALKGEVKARDRPEDALLNEDLEFERTSKPVPVITADVTESLEEMIRKRIKELNFDDLSRRVSSSTNFSSSKPRVELSDVKSSKSLTALYEDDYNGVTDDAVASEEMKKAHEEISDLYGKLVYKLDALSSAHFIPKPAERSLDIKVQTAAINMEDAQPLTMSNAPTLAPQELYTVGKSKNPNEIALKSGVILSKDELTRDHKNRLRRAMKRKKSKQANSQTQRSAKKSKKNDVIETLSKAKNVTVIDKKGEKRDVKGNIRINKTSDSTELKL